MEKKERLSIGEAAAFLAVSVDTLRRWDASGKLKAQRSEGKHRYYFSEDLKRFRTDLDVIGEAWAASEQAPEIPGEYYCERADRFTARLERFGVSLLRTGIIPERIVSLLVAVTGEIGDNSFAHNIGNWPDAPGIFYAYDINRRFVVLADRGQGVLKTLRRVKPDLEDDRDALQTAFTEYLSGRSPERRGNGLKLVREISEENPIGLYFQSGIAAVRIPKQPGKLTIENTLRNIRGTFARIEF
ncbi:MAG: helix-turn-helix domain-containing protein [Candidatus Yanofskybacteria bacterium]|nr:helix-turn-helix domain-containing protein [Candidatus Yanofskybacteria bacterium]